MRVIFSSQARADLDGIWLYLYQESRSEEIADGVVSRIWETAQKLSSNPMLGRTRADEFGLEMRSIPSGRYVIYYRIASGKIRILHVLHGSRDARRLLM